MADWPRQFYLLLATKECLKFVLAVGKMVALWQAGTEAAVAVKSLRNSNDLIPKPMKRNFFSKLDRVICEQKLTGKQISHQI